MDGAEASEQARWDGEITVTAYVEPGASGLNLHEAGGQGMKIGVVVGAVCGIVGLLISISGMCVCMKLRRRYAPPVWRRNRPLQFEMQEQLFVNQAFGDTAL